MAKKKAVKKKSAPKKKPSGGRSAYMAKAPIRRLMKNEGAGLVAEAAVVVLIEKLTSIAQNVTKAAVKYVKEDKRKRLTGADIVAAQRMMQ